MTKDDDIKKSAKLTEVNLKKAPIEELVLPWLLTALPSSGVVVLFLQIFWWLREAVWHPVSNKLVLCSLFNICNYSRSRMKGADLILNYILDFSYTISVLIFSFLLIMLLMIFRR
jgi:hypothetical protein